MNPADHESQIRAVIEARAEAIRSKDVTGALRHVGEASVGFFLAPPLQTKGPLKEELEGWFATFRGPIGYELRDVKITASDDLAFSHGFIHITGTKFDGELPDVWFRETLCFQKSDGQWRIAHAHESVPYYMDGSVKAAVDLKP